MKDEIIFNDPFHGFTIAKEAGYIFNPKCDQVIARTLDNELLGGVVYSQFTGENGSIAMHIAGLHPRWISKDLIWCCFDYPFNQLKVRKLFATVPASNEVAVKLDKRFGFTRPITIKDVYEDGDLIVMDMYKHECRWLGPPPRTFRR